MEIPRSFIKPLRWPEMHLDFWSGFQYRGNALAAIRRALADPP
jgi:hypothetical protein